MLHAFLITNRTELIDRCRQKVAKRRQVANHSQSEHGIPEFLDQLAQTLYWDQTSDRAESLKVAGPSDSGLASTTSEIHVAASKHGEELREEGFSIAQVVHGYGDLCQAVTELAAEKNTSISVEDFHTFNRCLDNAIAQAVTAYVGQWGANAPETSPPLEKQLGDDMSESLDSIVLALDLIKQGTVGVGGTLLNSDLALTRHLIDRSLTELRSQAARRNERH